MEITDEEKEFLDVAKRYLEASIIGKCHHPASWVQLVASYKALPKAYVPLLTDEELWETWSKGGTNCTQALRAVEVLTLRKAAEWLAEESRGEISMHLLTRLREKADAEEKR